MTPVADEPDGTRVAVVGLACRLPGAPDADRFWANLAAGVESLTVLPGEAAAPGHVPAAGVLEDAHLFDAGFFGCSPAEALILDPQQRLFLECAWEALEDAGCDPSTYPGAIGVYAGSSETGHLAALRAERARLPSVTDFQLRVATGIDYLTSRTAYRLGLRGPAVTVQTACSTSLVAIHLAAQALLCGDCDVALAGGATVHVPAEPADPGDGGIIARDGHCRAFDAEADGTVASDGVGVVVLKRLVDALAEGDHVRALLLGSAVNNDGAGKIGFTAPAAEGQWRAIRAAHRVAEVDVETIAYVETHGTATPLGDPIEVAALTRAFRAGTDRRGFCRIGSVKTNIGHTDAAAGVAGFIKTVLALEHRLVPPSLHFRRPNPELALESSPFTVAAAAYEWPAGGSPRRAGVSSFGIGGTNAHAVLEEAPAPPPPGPSRPHELLVLSARSRPALAAATARLADHLRRRPDAPLGDVAWTLQSGRRAHEHRGFVVCSDLGDAVRALTLDAPARLVTSDREPRERPVVFLFPGQGGQRVAMGRELYESEPAFRSAIDRGCELAEPLLGLDLRSVLYPLAGDAEGARHAAAHLERMGVGQPALFIVEMALARLWMRWGVAPAAVAGHSAGAYAAACVAGVLSLEDALALVVERSRILERLPEGAMLALPLPEAEVERLLAGGDLSLAAVNGPAQSVVSGPAASVAGLDARLRAGGVEGRRLRIATAAHSSLVEPFVAAFRHRAAGTDLRDPAIPFLSDMTGDWVAPGQLADPGYWAAHLRRTVRFGDALGVLLADPDRMLLEVGPGRALSTLAQQHPAASGDRHVVPSLPNPGDGEAFDLASVLDAAGRLWLAGAPISWLHVHEGRRRRRVRLPAYPFQRQPYLVSAPERPDEAVEAAEADAPPDAMPDGPTTDVERTLAGFFAEVLGLRRVGVHDSFFERGGDSLIAARLLALVRREFPLELPARAVFDAPTVAELARLIEARLAGRRQEV
ncbi:MAG TPA: beta-ketoacyl synthase N-terminal-like domain-containing protein [Candidatus Dormibacteraeota bacterium]|nr:beta-ketoacyl synthase N-terminal-like domain-containing protein [Candidatus Dormibacteraeota bacterium]